MIDITPLDVRNKRGDFKKLMRGYDPLEVDLFLEEVAERLETLVRESLQLRERTQALQENVNSLAGREQAVQDALVTAQELRADIHTQSQREADHTLKEAEVEARRLLAEADAEVRTMLRDVERQAVRVQDQLQDMEHRRVRFLSEFRGLLQRELDVVAVEEGRAPLEGQTIDLDLGVGRRAASGASRERGRSRICPFTPRSQTVWSCSHGAWGRTAQRGWARPPTCCSWPFDSRTRRTRATTSHWT